MKLGSLMEELISINGFMSDEELLPDSGVLFSVSDVENAVNEVIPTGPHHQSERHSLRRCLRHLNRCLTQIQEVQENNLTVGSENEHRFSSFSFSEKLQRNMIALVTKLKFPFNDDYALELAETVLNTAAHLLAVSAILYQPEHLRVILRRILQYGEDQQLQRRKADSWKHSICLSWLEIITQQWDHFDESSSQSEGLSAHNDPTEHFPVPHFTGTLAQCTRDLTSAIKTASAVFTEVNTVSESIILWHNLIVLMIRRLLQMMDSQANHHGHSVYSHRDHASSVSSLMDQNKGSMSGPLIHLWNEVEIYIHDLVELTLDKIDSAMSLRSSNDKTNLSSEKASTSLGTSFLEVSQNTDDLSDWKIVYIAVKLAVIASDAIEVCATSSHFKMPSSPKLAAKLWKGLATAFVTEIDLSCADQLGVSFCASVLSVAEVCLALDVESVPSSILMITFLRSLKFPDLLLDSENLWGAMKYYLAKSNNADLKHGLQAAALRTQQSITGLANTSREDSHKSAEIEKYDMLQFVIKRIIEIIPRNASSTPGTGSTNCASQTTDPWDEYFWRFMGSEPTNKVSS